MISKNKKFVTLILLMVLLGVMFNFIAAPMAYAQTSPPTPTPANTNTKTGSAGPLATTIGKWALQGFGAIGTVLLKIIALFTQLAGGIFDMAINYNINFTHLMVGPISNGWGITRNVTNIFFIIILLGIAIATILRVESHQAKALLPKLIIIALLINFSLTMGFIIIDFTNIIALQFYDKLRPGGIPVSEIIMRETQIQNVFNAGGPLNAQNTADSASTMSIILGKAVGVAISAGTGALIGGIPGAAVGTIGSLWSVFSGLGTDTFEQVSIAATIVWGNLILLSLMVMVFFVGAVLLLMRVVILGFLLILAPIAFLFYILPDTQKHWQTWWSTFINHAFFFPSFLFLLYVAITFVINVVQGVVPGPALESSPLLFTYILSIVMILAALILGRSMGIYGAATAMNWATNGRKWLTGFVGGVAARNLVAPIGERLKPAAARITQASPWLGWYARGAQEWLAKRGGAREMAEDQAKAALMQPKNTWAASFGKGNLPMREAMLKNLPEKERGEFLAKLPPELLQSAESIISSPRFSGAEQKDLAKSRMQFEMNQAQLQGNLGTFMSGLSEGNLPKYFGAMSEGQKTALLEEWRSNPATLDRFAKLTTTPPEAGGLKLEDQEKFRTSLKSVSGETASAYIDKLTGDAKEKTLKALSPSQLAHMYINNTAQRADLDRIMPTLAPDVQQQYNDAAAKILNQKPTADLISAIPSLSDNMTAAFIRSRRIDDNVDLINNAATPEPVKRKLLGSVKTAGLSDQYAKKLDPLTKVKYLDYAKPEDTDIDNAAREKFADLVSAEIKGRIAKELNQSISPKIMTEEVFKKALMKGANIQQLISMTDTAAKAEAVKNILFEATDKDFSADNLAKKLKDKFNNEILGQQLKDIREKSAEKMSPIERAFSRQIFG